MLTIIISYALLAADTDFFL